MPSSIRETSNFEHRNYLVPQEKGSHSIQIAKKAMMRTGEQEKTLNTESMTCYPNLNDCLTRMPSSLKMSK